MMEKGVIFLRVWEIKNKHKQKQGNTEGVRKSVCERERKRFEKHEKTFMWDYIVFKKLCTFR